MLKKNDCNMELDHNWCQYDALWFTRRHCETMCTLSICSILFEVRWLIRKMAFRLQAK